LAPAQWRVEPAILLGVHSVQAVGRLAALMLGEKLGQGGGVQATPRHAETLSEGLCGIKQILRDRDGYLHTTVLPSTYLR